jgi:3-deoxy-manno-octulosonate cytidylyltransferase (CMP-KDO synthetase)
VTILAVLPARLQATRLPRKPLRLLGGQPLILRVWERVSDLGLFDDVVIATDSAEVAEVVAESGARCVLTSDRHPSGTDRVAEVAAHPEFAGVRAIVNVQGDEPFVSAEAIRAALDMVIDRGFPIGTVAAPASPDTLARPEVVKVVAADDGRALYFSRAGIPFVREVGDAPERDRLVRQHLGVYAYTPDALARWVRLAEHPLERIERLEQLRPLAAGMAIGVGVVTEVPERGIDTEDDLVRANARWTDRTAGRT